MVKKLKKLHERFARHELVNPDCPVWAGNKKHIRERLAAAVAHLIKEGTLARADMMKIGEISKPQASNDLRSLKAILPLMMVYDLSAKKYVLRGF